MQPRSTRAVVSIDECPLRPQSVFRCRLSTSKDRRKLLAVLQREKSTVTGNAFPYKTVDLVFADTQEYYKRWIIPYDSPTSEWSRRSQLTNWPTESTRLDCQKTLVMNPNCFLPSCSDVTHAFHLSPVQKDDDHGNQAVEWPGRYL
jgi:hypothetical protein